MTTKELQAKIYKTHCSKGWAKAPRTAVEEISLVITEVAEAIECIRDGHLVGDVWFSDDGREYYDDLELEGRKPEGVAYEVADIAMRAFNFLSYWGFDVEELILRKDKYNQGRPKRHGKIL